jgi:hypothetical protein
MQSLDYICRRSFSSKELWYSWRREFSKAASFTLLNGTMILITRTRKWCVLVCETRFEKQIYKRNLLCWLIAGNGCSPTPFVPVMSAGKGKVKKITQFSRQAHWLSKRPNPEYSSTFQFLLRWISRFQTAYRAYLYLIQEKDFASFHIESELSLREDWTR